MSAPRILVYGASNFLGSRILAALGTEPSWTPVGADARTPITPQALRDVRGVVNAAVGDAPGIRAQARLATSAARAAGEEVLLVHLSSMTVYGSAVGIVAESVPVRADLGAYAAAHIEAEEMARTHARTVILRPGCEYGPGCAAWSERIGRLLIAHRLGDLGSAGDGYCNLIYIDDLADAVAQCLRRPAIDGVFNLAMRAPPRWNEYLIRFGVALRAVPVRRIGARALRWESTVMAVPRKLAEVGARRLGAQRPLTAPPLTPSLLRLCRQEIVLAPDRAEELLGIRWTPLDVGIARAAAAFAR